jgi:hypothetical protein
MRLMSKVFVCIDGLPSTSTKFCKIFDSLGNLIRGAEIDMKDFKINNLLNFVMLTKPMRLEPDEKERYVIFTINGGRRLEDYGDNLFTEDSAIDFFNYLRRVSSFQYSEKDLNVIPMSAGMNSMESIPMSLGMNSMESFLKEVKERTLNDTITLLCGREIAIHEISVNEKVKVRKADLFSVYSDYCDLLGKDCLKAKTFNKYLPEKRCAEARYYLV